MHLYIAFSGLSLSSTSSPDVSASTQNSEDIAERSQVEKAERSVL